MTSPTPRRTGDTTAIPGDYQYQAATASPSAVQRFWHQSKTTVIDALCPPQAGEFVLDVGCGSGVISDHLARSGAEVVGIDGNEEAIAFARTHWQRPNLRFHLGLVDEAFETPRPVDKIYSLELIEHLYRDQVTALLASFKRLMRPGGLVYLTTPNYRSLWPAIEWAMDTLRLAPPLRDHQHVTHFNPTSLVAACREAGLEVTRLAKTMTLSPWVAPLSRKSADSLLQAEMRGRLPLGSILHVVARV